MGYVFIVYGAASAVAAVTVGKMLGTVSITLVSLLNVCLNIGLVAFLLIWEREPNYAVMFIVAILWGICDGSWTTLTSSKWYYMPCSIFSVYIYVTGFWKTDQIVTLGLFHFIGPANGHTCTLHIHSAITRLGGLVCFSRASFANPINS